jgi:hypothetical protein
MADKFTAQVRVLRSYDYCHFEVALSTDQPMEVLEVDAMRKVAALLVDEAVRQYRVAKDREGRRTTKETEAREFIRRCEHLKTLPIGELTPENAAILRAYADQSFMKAFDQDRYLYEDGEKEHHFSMLNQFKEATVRV